QAVQVSTLTPTKTLTAPTLTVVDAHGTPGTPISLDHHIVAALTNDDGLEQLGINIGNVPTGAVLSAGVDAGNGIWVLTPAQLAGLTITLPKGATTSLSLSVTAVAAEGSLMPASATKTLHVVNDSATGSGTGSGTTTGSTGSGSGTPTAGVIMPHAVPQP